MENLFPWFLVRRVGVRSTKALEQARSAIRTAAHQPTVKIKLIGNVDTRIVPMIRFKVGDIVAEDAEALVNTVNCVGAMGLAGFKAMFANQVVGRYGKVHGRIGKQQAWPTDRQAEVLYLKQLSCEHLLCIYVQCEDSAEPIHGILAGLQVSVEVRHTPEVFE